MKYENNDRLREFLDRGAAGAYREHLLHPRFELDEEAFASALCLVHEQFPDLSEADAEARAVFRLLTGGAAPPVAVPLPSRWFRCAAFLRDKTARSWPWLKLAWAVALLALSITSVLLLSALVARAEPTPQNMQAIRQAMRGVNLLAFPAAAQQPGGIILQFQQSGSALATRPAGLVAFNCSTGLSCSFSGTTFTLTSTGGGGGSGCVPSGGTANAFLFDTGSGTCDDISKITWNSATSTGSVNTGGLLTYSGTGIINARNWAGTSITNTESFGKIPIGNGDGTASWSDPFVSGITAHDAVATSTNPVLMGGYASAAAPSNVSADGDAVRAWLLRNGSQVFNLASGGTLVTLGQKAMTSSLPVVLASDQSAVPVTGPLTDTQLRATAVPVDITGGSGVDISNVGSVRALVSLPVDTSGNPIGNATNPLTITCASGCGGSGGTSSSFGAVFPATGTAVGMSQGGNMTALSGDGSGNLKVSCVSGCSGTTLGQTTMANSLPVAIASNQSAVPVSGTVTTTPPSNASTNITQFGGTNISTGTGAGGAGIPRVTISSDSSLAANQSVNIAQMNGVATSVNNGTAGTGVQRVVVASDNSAVSGFGVGTTGGAVPANASYIAGIGTGNTTGYLNCDNTAIYDTSTNGSTQLVALTSIQNIYVCGYQFSTSSSSAVSVNLRYGTGTNCATGATNITPSYPLQAAASTGPIGMVVMTPGFTGLKTAASTALCINTNAAVSVQAIVWYTKF